jgi:hypothetical protein
MEENSHSNVRRHRKPRATQKHSDTACDNEHDPCHGEPHSLEQVITQLGELREYSVYYLNAKIAKIKLKLRQTAVYLLLIVLGTFAAFALIFTTIWLLLVGMAEGVGTLLGGRTWLGNLSVAAIVLIGICAVAWLTIVRRNKRSTIRTVQQYEQRQREQKAKFGHTVSEQANARRTRAGILAPDDLSGKSGPPPRYRSNNRGRPHCG